MIGERDLREAMSPVLYTLAADGYEGRYELIRNVLRLEISAGDGVCEDCLSPKEVMARIVGNSLAKAGFDVEVELRYPMDSAGAFR